MKYDWKGEKSSDAIWSKEQMESLLFSFLVDNAESKQIQFYTLKALLHGKASIAILA
jgi:hypothetical protein